MMSDEELEPYVNKIKGYKKGILDTIQEIYDCVGDSETLTEHCAEMKCEECPLGGELLFIRKVECWMSANMYKESGKK